MKTIIAGSRNCTEIAELLIALSRCGWQPTTVVSGTARGADKLGERWAAAHGLLIEQFPADWDAHGKAAGYRRNEQMADHAEALIALWDGKSRGTKHMIDIAKRNGLRVYVHLVDNP